MEINLTDGKCTIDISNYYEDIIITSSDPILFNFLSMMQKESICIYDIYSDRRSNLYISVDRLTYDQLLLIEQILENVTINSRADIQCILYLEITIQCEYLEERFGYEE